MRALSDRSVVVRLVRDHAWPIGVFALYGASAVVLPTLTEVSIHDDWVYARSVETLVRDGRLEVLDPVAANLVSQTFWGSLFALVFGLSLGVLRVSTVVMVGLGGVALYALGRRLGVPRPLAALGTGTYLFFPLQYVITFSFMTDPHATALIIIATYLYVTGLDRDTVRVAYVISGSTVAALAYLTRPQGLLVPAGVVLYLLFSRRVGWNKQAVRILTSVVSVPIVAAIIHTLWLVFVNGVPAGGQTNFLSSLMTVDAARLVPAGGKTLLNVATYAGLVALPITLSALRSGREILRTSDRPVFLVTTAWAVTFAVLYYFLYRTKLMPFVGNWMRPEGLGPLFGEIAGGRNRTAVLGRTGLLVVTLASFASSIASVLLVSRHLRRRWRPPTSNEDGVPSRPASELAARRGASIVGTVACLQVVGVAFPALKVGYPFDRYLLPVLPLALVLVIWAVKDVRLWRSVAWGLLAVYAFLAIVGTRNFLVTQDAVWELAGDAVQAGVPITKIDAGAGWDGYWTYEQRQDAATPAYDRTYPAWWLDLWGRAIDPTYVVGGGEIDGYRVVRQRSIPRWFRDDYTLMLLHRAGDQSYL